MRQWDGLHLVSCLALFSSLISDVGCTSNKIQYEDISPVNLVESGNPHLERQIGDVQNQFHILASQALDEKLAAGQLEGAGKDNTGNNPSSLFLGIPLKMLKRPMIFGSVVTQVSEKENQDWGGLKLADIPAYQIILIFVKTGTQSFGISIRDCKADCSLATEQDEILQLPGVAFDITNKVLYLNTASLGSDLDIMTTTSVSRVRKKNDPKFKRFRSNYPFLKTYRSNFSEVLRFDYSKEVLVFDVQTHLTEKRDQVNEIQITNRWYLKPISDFNPSFIQRTATPGIGYFMTESISNQNNGSWIQRWDIEKNKKNFGIKYFIKNVPLQFQPAFADAFDEWNEKLLPVFGKKIFNYEFIQVSDQRNELLISGDARYNIIEWDLLNKASYGGLGPSLVNQNSGEIFQGSVLIQGPVIVDLYRKWFEAGQYAERLRFAGMDVQAKKVMSIFSNQVKDKITNPKERFFKVNLGKTLKMTVRSQQPALEDPIMSKEDFDIIPEGYTFDLYMHGYFRNIIVHELGHNLGLRHNFKGSLGAVEGDPIPGGVSRSVMEYLGRAYRQLDRIGEYDIMAIAYGYLGIAPIHIDWYCTDEDSADLNDPTKSAECTSEDATNDPFSFFENKLVRSVELLVAHGKTGMPDWSVDDLKSQIKSALVGLGTYAVSAEQTFLRWTNFLNRAGRPNEASLVKPYVLDRLKAILCDQNLIGDLNIKETADAKAKVQINLLDLKKLVVQTLKPLYQEAELACLGI